MTIFFISVFGALFISGLCSLMEATLLSLQPSQIAEIQAKSPGIGAIWQRFKEGIEKPIAAILILNTTAHTIGASVAGANFPEEFGGAKNIWIFSLIFTFLMLQFTEILPKSAGVRYNRQFAYGIAKPLDWLIKILSPVVHAVHWINRPFAGKADAESTGPSVDEIAALAGMARLSKTITPQQEQIIKEGARLAVTKVHQVMKSRVQIDALDIDMPQDRIVAEVVRSGHSRLPVYKGNLDHIVGFVFIKDVLRKMHEDQSIDLADFHRPAPLVPETLTLDRLLQVFRKERTQIAIVLDEYGGTAGLVTMEDVLEEFVGDIFDEHRLNEGSQIRQRDELTWIVGGTVNLRDLLKAMRISEQPLELPQEIDTVGGLIQWQLQRIPEEGDRATIDGIDVEVIEMDGPRVWRVSVSLHPKEPESQTE